MVKLWVILICAILTGERDPGSEAQPNGWAFELGPPRATCIHLETPACFGHRSSDYLQVGLQKRRIRLLSTVIKIRGLSRGYFRSHLVHMPPSSVSFPRWQGQPGGRASASLFPAWSGSEAGMCFWSGGLRSASRGPRLLLVSVCHWANHLRSRCSDP